MTDGTTGGMTYGMTYGMTEAEQLILLIDTAPTRRAQWRTLLLQRWQQPCRVIEADTASEGLSRLTSLSDAASPCCVLLGVPTPLSAAVGALLHFTRKDGAPICAVITLGPDDEDLSRALLQAGAQDHLDPQWLTAGLLARAVERAVEFDAMQRALRSGEQQLCLAQEAAALGLFDYEPGSGLLHFDAQAHTLWCMGGAAVPAHIDVFLQSIHAQDRSAVEASLAQALDPQGSGRCCVEYRQCTGTDAQSPRWLRTTAQALFADGRTAGLIATLQDVSERRQAEQRQAEALAATQITQSALDRSERQTRSLLHALPGGAAFVVDPQLRYVLADGEALGAAGFKPEDFIGKRVDEVLDAQTAQHHLHYYRQALAGESFTHEHEAHQRCYLSRGVPLRNEAGAVYGALVFSHDITDRKRAEEQLRRSHDTFLGLIQNAPFGVYLVDAQFRLAQASVEAQRVFSNVPQPLLGRDLAEVLRVIWPEPFATKAITRFRRTLDTGEPYEERNTTHQRGDIPSVKSYDWKIERVALPDGGFGVVCYFYDITDRHLAEREARFLAELSERVRTAVDADNVLAACTQLLCDQLSISRCYWVEMIEDEDRWVVRHDCTAAPLFAGSDSAASPDQRVSAFERSLLQDLRNGRVIVYEDLTDASRASQTLPLALSRDARSCVVVPVLRAGQWTSNLVLSSPTPHAWHPRTVALLETVAERAWNAAEKLRLDAELLASESRYRAFVAQSSEAIWRFELEQPLRTELPVEQQIAHMYRHAYLAECNDAMARMYGYAKAAEIVGTRLGDLVPEDDPQNRAYLAAFIAARYRLVDAESHEVDRKGERRFFLNNLSGVVEQGRLLRAWGTQRDITERKQMEEVLRGSEQRFRDLAETMPQIVWMSDSDGNVSYFNRRWYDYTGLSVAQSVGLSWQIVLHPDDREACMLAWQQATERKGAYEIEMRYRGADGSYRWFLARALPVTDERGEIDLWFGTSTDIEDAKRHAEQLAESNRRLEESVALLDTVFDKAPVGLTFLDSSFRYVRINETLSDLNGVSVNDHLGRSVAEVLPKMWPAVQPLLMRVRETGQPLTNVEVRAPVPARNEPDGYWLASYYPISVRDRLFGYGIVAMDLTDQKRAEQSLIDSDRRKDEFLATLAHELRNPLAPIRSGLEVLNRTQDAQAARQTREMMERQLAHMVRLIDDLLDVSRISSGKVTLRRERLSLQSAVQAAVESARPLIEAAGHVFEVDMPVAPIWLDADRTRLAQVIGNLLTNAAKYTPDGGRIWLHVRQDLRQDVRRDVRRDEKEVQISVRDTGFGVPPDMKEHLFNMFAQVNRTLDRAQGGLGIGLALVKRLVELHGGRVSVQSAGTGQGSTFTVHLPLASDMQRGLDMPPPVRAATIRRTAMRVLVVDDNVDAADSLAMMLRLGGHEVHTAFDGPSALAQASNCSPHLVFLDIGLPGMNGYAVARKFRADARLAGTVLIAVTGWGSEDDKQEAKNAGFDFHLTKPVDPNTIDAVLARFSPMHVASTEGSR